MHPGQHLADRDDATPGCMTRLHGPVLPVERQRYQEDDARTTSHVISQPRLAAPGCRTLRWRRFCIAGGRQSLPLHRRRGVGAVHGMLVVLVCARWAEAAWLRPILASRSHALSMAVADVSANGAPTQAGTCAECGLPGCPWTATVLSCVRECECASDRAALAAATRVLGRSGLVCPCSVSSVSGTSE